MGFAQHHLAGPFTGCIAIGVGVLKLAHRTGDTHIGAFVDDVIEDERRGYGRNVGDGLHCRGDGQPDQLGGAHDVGSE
jgi:hypothetical protein